VSPLISRVVRPLGRGARTVRMSFVMFGFSAPGRREMLQNLHRQTAKNKKYLLQSFQSSQLAAFSP
jgi:hypothetical protein